MLRSSCELGSSIEHTVEIVAVAVVVVVLVLVVVNTFLLEVGTSGGGLAVLRLDCLELPG